MSRLLFEFICNSVFLTTNKCGLYRLAVYIYMCVGVSDFLLSAILFTAQTLGHCLVT